MDIFLEKMLSRIELCIDMNSILSVVRYKEWYDSKWNCYFLVFMYFLFVNHRDFSMKILLDFMTILLFSFCLLAFGYAYNDFCDQEKDRKAKKSNSLSALGKRTQLVILSTTVALGVGVPIIRYRSLSCMMIVILSFILAFAYSNKRIRLKELNSIGLFTSSIAQRVAPMFLIFYVFCSISAVSIMIAILSFLIGIRWILIHQHYDISNDAISETNTFVLRQNNVSRLVRLTSVVLVSEIVALIVIMAAHFPKMTISSVLVIFTYALFQIYLLPMWRKVGWLRIILSYDFAPLADFYYLWLPLLLSVNLTIIDNRWFFLIFISMYFGYRYVILDVKHFKLRWQFR